MYSYIYRIICVYIYMLKFHFQYNMKMNNVITIFFVSYNTFYLDPTSFYI